MLVFDERQGVQVKDRDGPGWIAATFGGVDPSRAEWIENPGVGDGGYMVDQAWVIYLEADRAETPSQVPLAVATSRHVRASAMTLCGFTVRFCGLFRDLPRSGWAVRSLPDLRFIEVDPDRLSGLRSFATTSSSLRA